MLKKTLVSIALANLMLVGAASAQFATKAEARANGGGEFTPVVNAGGDDCGTAAPVASLPFNDSGDTTGATNTINDIPLACNGNYTQTQGPDHIYSFTTSAGAGNVAITVTPTTGTYDTSIYVLGTCGTSASCVVGADNVLAGVAETIPAQAYPDGTYALYIDSFYAAGNGQEAGGYTVDITGALPVELTGFSVD